jgi:hypothetical protein
VSIYQTCPECGLSTSEGGRVCELCLDERTQKKLDQLTVENFRLREALQKFSIGGCECCTEGSLSRDEMIDISRSALEGK